MCSFEKPQTSPNSLSPSTTVLSPYVTFGCLSARTFWWRIAEVYQGVSVTFTVHVWIQSITTQIKLHNRLYNRLSRLNSDVCRKSTQILPFPFMASCSGESSSTLPVWGSQISTRWRAIPCVRRWTGTQMQNI